MLNNLTIIIPTHERQELLFRSLKFYKKYNISIIIVDSSKKAIADKIKLKWPKNFKYFHTPNQSISSKLFFAINKVGTKYVNLCPDDDFLNMESLLEGIKYLESNKCYISVQGLCLNFLKKNNQINFFLPTLNECKLNYNAENADIFKRVEQHFGNQHEYALFRTDVAYKCLETVSHCNMITPFHCSFTLVGLLYGYHKNLNILWMARDKARYSIYKNVHGNDQIKEQSILEIDKANSSLEITNWSEYIATNEGVLIAEKFNKLLSRDFNLRDESNFLTNIISTHTKKYLNYMSTFKQRLKNKLHINIFSIYIKYRDSKIESIRQLMFSNNEIKKIIKSKDFKILKKSIEDLL